MYLFIAGVLWRVASFDAWDSAIKGDSAGHTHPPSSQAGAGRRQLSAVDRLQSARTCCARWQVCGLLRRLSF